MRVYLEVCLLGGVSIRRLVYQEACLFGGVSIKRRVYQEACLLGGVSIRRRVYQEVCLLAYRSTINECRHYPTHVPTLIYIGCIDISGARIQARVVFSQARLVYLVRASYISYSDTFICDRVCVHVNVLIYCWCVDVYINVCVWLGVCMCGWVCVYECVSMCMYVCV